MGRRFHDAGKFIFRRFVGVRATGARNQQKHISKFLLLFKKPGRPLKRPYKAEAARQVIAALEKAGMLKEVTGRKWGQLFVARPILKVIEKPFAA